MSFVKIYGTILDSSVWAENKETRLVWITLLAMADKDGYVEASYSGLARRAAVSMDECRAATAILEAPDSDSKDSERAPENEGRRIEKVSGGWVLLNHTYYRDLRTEKQVIDAQRQARHRAERDVSHDDRDASQGVTKRDLSHDSVTCHNCHSDVAIDADADADTDTEITTTSSSPRTKIIMQALGIPSAQEAQWAALLNGMTQGLGTPGMRAVDPDTLLVAAQELAASGGDVTPSRYKAFVRKVMGRDVTDVTVNKGKGKTSRSTDALAEWLNDNDKSIEDAEVIDDGE